MACALAAIDMQNLAGDKGCVFEVQRTMNDVSDSSYAVLGMHLGVHTVGVDTGVDRSIHDPRRYRVDPDTLRGILNRE